MTAEYRFRHVLFAALNSDPEPPAHLVDAIDFMAVTGASLTLFDVVPPISQVQRQLRIGNRQIDETDFAAEIRREQLEGWARHHRDRLRAEVAMSTGRRSIEVARRVTAARHDLVVVAPDGSGDDLGVVRRLIRVAPCAVLILRGPILDRSVLAAVDPDDQLTLNVMVVSAASGIAALGERVLHLVHGYEPHGAALMRAHDFSSVDDEDIATYVDDVRDAHQHALTDLIDRIAPRETIRTHVDVGSPLEVIARNVVELDASIVTVGAGGRHRMHSALIGNTADRVVTHTLASVLIVKPPGLLPIVDSDDAAWSVEAEAQAEADASVA